MIARMMHLCRDQSLEERADRLLLELVQFGTMDALPRSRFDEGGDPDPEDNREEIYLPKPSERKLEDRLTKVRIGSAVGPHQGAVQSLLREFQCLFSDPRPGVVPRKLVEHAIVLRDDKFITARGFRMGQDQVAALKKHIEELLKARMIRQSSSPFSSAIFGVPKKDESGKTIDTRWVMDYRGINANTVPDRYPIPNIEELLTKVGKAQLFSKLDLKSSYWQILIRRGDEPKTAFTTPFGLYEWVVMPFGLCNAPATFQRLIDRVLRDCCWAIGYFDDILIFSERVDEHLNHIRDVCSRLRRFGLRVNPAKCILFVEQVRFLGYVLSRGRLHADRSKVDAIRTYPRPTCLREIQRFLGLVGFYRKFIRNFCVLAVPLSRLTRRGVPFVWEKEQQEAFETLRDCLTQSPILALPDNDRKLVVETDASIKGIGGVLSQDFRRVDFPLHLHPGA